MSLPTTTREHSGSLEGADGAALSKSVDDMLLATGGSTEVEGRTVSSKTAGLETLLSQVWECGCVVCTHAHPLQLVWCTQVCVVAYCAL